MGRKNCGTERHCNYTYILSIRNPVVTSAVTKIMTIRNFEVMGDKFNGNTMSVLV